MKIIKINLVIIFLLSCLFQSGFSQVIEKPGESTTVSLGEESLVAEDLSGSYSLTFSGIDGGKVPSLTREETNASGSGIGSYDELETLYSGKVYSVDEKGEEEVFIEFQDKTPEQLSQIEIEVNPENSGSEVPPNIHGIIASRLAKISDEFPPEFIGQLFGEIISRIAEIQEKECDVYFNRVFEEIEIIRNEESLDFPDNIYERVVNEITQVKGETCQGGYSLFLDLEAKATSKSMEHELSDDAGVYESLIKVNLTKTE